MYTNHTLKTNPRHSEEEPLNTTKLSQDARKAIKVKQPAPPLLQKASHNIIAFWVSQAYLEILFHSFAHKILQILAAMLYKSYHCAVGQYLIKGHG